MEEIIQDKEIQAIQSETVTLKGRVDSLAVFDESSQKLASTYLAYITKAVKKLEEKRVFFTKPILESKKNIDREFQEKIHPLEAMAKVLKNKLLFYSVKQRADAEARADAAVTFAEKNNIPSPSRQEIAKAITESQGPVRTVAGSTFTTKRWAWRIIDETKIPREYLLVDEKKINAMVKANIRVERGVNTMGLKIDGIEFYQDESISVKT